METLNHSLNRLWQHITMRRRFQFVGLLILMVASSCVEIISIGAILPFLSILVEPERIFNHPALQILLKKIGFNFPHELLLPMTLTFIVAALASGFLRLTLLWASTKLSFATGADFSSSIYRRTLYQPYSSHLDRNSSEVIGGVSTKANNVIYYIISPFLTIVNSCVMLVLIFITLLIIDPIHSMIIFGAFGIIYAVIIGLTRKKLLRDGKRATIATNQLIKALQEGLGGIRDIIIDSTQEYFCEIYRKIDLSLRQAQADTHYIGTFPRYALEAVGLVFLAVFAYSLTIVDGALIGMIPILGVMALSAQRLLPILQQFYSAYTSLQSGRAMLEDTLSLLDQPLPKYASDPRPTRLRYNSTIALKNVSFGYQTSGPLILNNINFEIRRGKSIGIIGSTGSGKSTLLDVIMGLLTPTGGALEIDSISIDEKNNRNWQANIAHVPQYIYLSDGTISENIAFGVDISAIDYDLVKRCAKVAQIDREIEGFTKKYETYVGERGIRLSGGQRQRIGIARALYKKANFIILDEATSALDTATEEKVMHAIETFSADITLLIVAHRISTLKNCDDIFELKNGQISNRKHNN